VDDLKLAALNHRRKLYIGSLSLKRQTCIIYGWWDAVYTIERLIESIQERIRSC
jgi:hypothetical protein